MARAKVIKGTTLEMTVSSDLPQFAETLPPENGGMGAFEIRTDTSFSENGAKQGNATRPYILRFM